MVKFMTQYRIGKSIFEIRIYSIFLNFRYTSCCFLIMHELGEHRLSANMQEELHVILGKSFLALLPIMESTENWF